MKTKQIRKDQAAGNDERIEEIIISPDNVDALDELDGNQLKALWAKHYGKPPPPRARKSLMVDCLAYRIQEQVFGGLALSTRTRLKKIALDIRDGKQIALITERRIKPGTRLIRSWGDETHTVETLEEGFVYRGQQYGNLSEVARVITGSRWSGPLFFGLKKRKANAREVRDAE